MYLRYGTCRRNFTRACLPRRIDQSLRSASVISRRSLLALLISRWFYFGKCLCMGTNPLLLRAFQRPAHFAGLGEGRDEVSTDPLAFSPDLTFYPLLKGEETIALAKCSDDYSSQDFPTEPVAANEFRSHDIPTQALKLMAIIFLSNSLQEEVTHHDRRSNCRH